LNMFQVRLLLVCIEFLRLSRWNLGTLGFLIGFH
jgi:hypothetical protein